MVLTAGMQEPAVPSPRRGARIRDGQDPAAAFDVPEELSGFLQGVAALSLIGAGCEGAAAFFLLRLAGLAGLSVEARAWG